MQPTNDSRLRCSPFYMPVHDIEQVTGNVWKGKRVIEPGTKEDESGTIFFNRSYDENYISDRVFREIEITDIRIIGFPFWLVPKEKMLFLYDEPSKLIKRPDIKLAKGTRPII